MMKSLVVIVVLFWVIMFAIAYGKHSVNPHDQVIQSVGSGNTNTNSK